MWVLGRRGIVLKYRRDIVPKGRCGIALKGRRVIVPNGRRSASWDLAIH